MSAPSAPARADAPSTNSSTNPWPALWALVIGFFMILVDSTIVSVATPAIMRALDTDVDTVLWVTSAYLLAYAVPLLITGRLGDRVGPKKLYLVGLAVFTAASLWCGLTGTITALIVARVVQGLGASLMTPQTMSVITRTFPAESRGQATALWGATAGVATLVGPILGGVLTDGPGWEWIFFVNVPVGIIAFALAARLVPNLETRSHSFDWVGVVLSSVAMFLIVFGLQEGEKYDWGTITGIVSVPLFIAVGVVVLGVFVWWQGRVRTEPLVPLGLFRDRNFSVSNLAITAVGFSVTAFAFPFILYAQAVRGLSPTGSALLLVPMALLSGGLAPVVGRLTDKAHPRTLVTIGMVLCAVSLVWLSREMTPTSATWQLLLPMAFFGASNAFLWAPLAATATRNLPMSAAGAGSGVYNTTRQIGAVLGSAAIAAVISARLAANLPGAAANAGQMQTTGGTSLPAAVAGPFATSMAQAILLPAAVIVLGLVAALFLTRPGFQRSGQPAGRHRVGAPEREVAEVTG